MNLKTIAFAGLLSLFPTEITYAKPASLEDKLKELAELAMKCGEKASFEDYGSQNGISGRYHVDSYSLAVPVNPDGNKALGLPFPETIYFQFRDGTIQKTPNRSIDQDESFEVIGDLGKGVEYFRCSYQRKNDSPGRTCTGPFIDDLLEARIRKAIEFIKENISPKCYGNIV